MRDHKTVVKDADQILVGIDSNYRLMENVKNVNPTQLF